MKSNVTNKKRNSQTTEQRQQDEGRCINWSYDTGNKLKKVCRQATATALLIICLAFLSGCSGILDGPFNHSIEKGSFDDLDMVPELLYANNDSGLVTYWDEETQSYRSYDQNNNRYLANAVYTKDDYEISTTGSIMIASASRGPRVQMDGNKVMVRSDIMNAELNRLGVKSNIKW